MVNQSKQDDSKCDIQTYHSKYIEELRIHVKSKDPIHLFQQTPESKKDLAIWTNINYARFIVWAHSMSYELYWYLFKINSWLFIPSSFASG